jgi:ketosteroid isomerase-like protein
MADTVSIHREMFDAIKARDFDRIRELYHPDYQYLSADGQEGGADVAIANNEAYTTAFSDIEFEILNEFASGDWSCIEYRGKGTHDGDLQGIAPTGKHVEGQACSVIQVRDGSIYRERDYFDTLTILQQIGAAPTG